MHLTDWLAVVGVGWLVVITPGPNMAVVLRNSLVHSRTAGLYTALGLVLGNLVHVAYCLVGIGVLIAQSLLLFTIIKWCGAAYLIYLGLRSLLSRPSHPEEHPLHREPGVSRGAALRMGLLTDLLNPKATLFFLALFTQFIEPTTPLFAQGLYGLTVITIEFVWFAFLVSVTSHPIISRHVRGFTQRIERVTGVVLIAVGIRVAVARGTT